MGRMSVKLCINDCTACSFEGRYYCTQHEVSGVLSHSKPRTVVVGALIVAACFNLSEICCCVFSAWVCEYTEIPWHGFCVHGMYWWSQREQPRVAQRQRHLKAFSVSGSFSASLFKVTLKFTSLCRFSEAAVHTAPLYVLFEERRPACLSTL